MRLKIRYIGKRIMDLIPNKIYDAEKVHDKLGEGYAIFDEGEDWYRYGLNFVKENFEAVTSENEIDFKMAV